MSKRRKTKDGDDAPDLPREVLNQFGPYVLGGKNKRLTRKHRKRVENKSSFLKSKKNI